MQFNYCSYFFHFNENALLFLVYLSPVYSHNPPPSYPYFTNPYTTTGSAQYPGQYAHPSPGTLLTTPGYYYMPANTLLTHPTSTTASSATPISANQLTSTSTVSNSTWPSDAQTVRPVPSPVVESTRTVNAQHSLTASSVERTESRDINVSVALPGLTPTEPLLSNVEPEPLLSNVEPEPLVSFSNLSITSSPLPIDARLSNNLGVSESKEQSATNNAKSPERVKRAFNPLPRRQPSVKAYLAHEEL